MKIDETQLIRSAELHNLGFCPDIISLMKRRSVAWTECEARTGGEGSADI
jgi:hypothetical protein